MNRAFRLSPHPRAKARLSGQVRGWLVSISLITVVLAGCASPPVQPDVVDVLQVPADTFVLDVPRDVPTPVSAIGRECMAELIGNMPGQGDCEEGQICLPEEFGFNAGYCSSDCSNDPCPRGSTCVPVGGQVRLCLKNCTTSADCRPNDGYRCQNPGNGRSVCLPTDGPVGLRDGRACYTTAAGAHQLPALARRTFSTPNVSLSSERPDTQLQAEGNVAINPINGAVATSYIAVARNGVFMGVSTQFADGTVQRVGAVRDPSLQTTSDPVLAYTADGRLHMVFLGYNVNGQGRPTAMRLRYATSGDDGRSWAPAVGIEPNQFCVGGCDKPWIVIGPTPANLLPADAGVQDSGAVDAGEFDGAGSDGGGTDAGADDPRLRGISIYVGIMVQLNGGRTVQLHILRSDNGGRTFTLPMPFTSSGGGVNPITPNLLTPVVDPSGTVHVTYAGIGGSRFGDAANRVFYRRSTDGGVTWSSQVTVSRPMDTPVYGQPVVVTDGGRLHIAYINGNLAGQWDMILATSENGGTSWTHRKVNDEPDSCATHAFPWIVADNAGRGVHAMWLENRFGDGAVGYALCPSNPAMPCGANEQISDASFTFETVRDPSKWHGDYLGFSQAADGTLWAGWSDTRTATPSMYLARGTVR